MSLAVKAQLSHACTHCVIAGATADAFTLFERLEMQLEQHPGEVLAVDVLPNFA